MTTRPLPPIEFLHEKFSYDKETGLLSYKKTGKPIKGKRHPGRNGRFYLIVYVRSPDMAIGYRYMVHRIIMALLGFEFEPNVLVDHIDGDGLNNRRENLRLATNQQNAWNNERFRTLIGPILPRGVYPNGRGKWKAVIRINDKLKHLGTFRKIQDASDAYTVAAKMIRGEFYRAGAR